MCVIDDTVSDERTVRDIMGQTQLLISEIPDYTILCNVIIENNSLLEI